MYNTELAEEYDDLKGKVQQNQRKERQRRLMGRISSLYSLLDERSQRQRPVSPPVQEYNPMSDIMQNMQKQQESMLEMIKNMRNPEPPQNRAYPYTPKQEVSQSPIEDQYRRIRNNPDEYKKLLDELNLTETETDFDPSMSIQDKAKLRDRLKGRQERMQRRKLKGKSKFRAAAFAVLFPIFAYGESLERRGGTRNSNIKGMEDSIQIFTEVAKTWVLKAARSPITSIVNDPHLDLNVLSKERWWKNSNKEQNQLKIIKISVRIRGVLDGFIENTNEYDMPGPLRLFIDRLTSNGSTLPPTFLLPFEKTRLEFDAFAGLRNQNNDKKQMQVALFFITRVLIGKFFLHPDENSLPIRRNSKILTQVLYRNFKILGTFIEMLVLTTFCNINRTARDAVVDETEIMNRKNGVPLSVVRVYVAKQ